jgi:16S rRNA (guanine966-N2)-methyltransferase
MRIIAGNAKGRILLQPAGVTRPTSDRTREGIFSALESEIGTCEGITFLDLFGGTGAVGLEALSRGASEVVAVEKNKKAAGVCRENYELVKSSVSGKFSTLQMSVDSYLDLEQSKLLNSDVVYLDPPYEVANEVIEKILSKILERGILHPDAVVIVERSSRVAPFSWPTGLLASKERKYGEGAVYFGLLSAIS